MIKINLLTPEKSKKARKKSGFDPQMIWIGLGSVVLLMTWYIGWSLLSKKVEQLQIEETRLSTELASLKTQVKEVENFEENKKKVKEKIQIIQQLRKNQAIPVHLLDEISKSLPNRVWLVSLNEQAGKVDLSGKAITNNEIVDFINNLKSVSSFKDVQILESRQGKEADITVYSFRLKWSLLS